MDAEIKNTSREEAIKRAKMRKRIRLISFIGIPILALGAFAWWGIRSASPLEPDMSTEYPNQGQAHIQENAEHPAYNSNPPTSGWHYGSPAKLGFYDEELPDEALVHNLEHGEIWISFKPSVSDEVKAELKNLLGPRVIITKRERNDTDIAVAAWTRLDTFNLENGTLTDAQKTRINDFIKRWQNRGPEKVVSQPF